MFVEFRVYVFSCVCTCSVSCARVNFRMYVLSFVYVRVEFRIYIVCPCLVSYTREFRTYMLSFVRTWVLSWVQVEFRRYMFISAVRICRFAQYVFLFGCTCPVSSV